MEVSVSFTGENEIPDPASYVTEQSPAGKVYIPAEGVIITGPVRIRYEKYPWIEKFELDGIKAAPAKRTGVGTKGARGFVRSLSTIYSPAYDEYYLFGGDSAFDARGYFSHAAESFIPLAADGQKIRLFRKFCGFTENMWREGSETMLRIALDVIVPLIHSDAAAWPEFIQTITPEFRDYLENVAQIAKQHPQNCGII